MNANAVKESLRALNYQSRDLGLGDGLASEVPEDADMIIMLGPSKPFLPSELAALDRYLARGGKLMLALDPMTPVDLGVLWARLGVTFDPVQITDDRYFVAQSRSLVDRRFIATERFSSHAAITTLSRATGRAGAVFLNAGSWTETEAPSEQLKRTYIVRSMETSFRDLNDNLRFDEDTEKREQYNLVAAIEDRTARPAGDEGEGDNNVHMRALLVSDVEIFSDMIQSQVASAAIICRDGVRWLGGEEHIAGDVISEEDVRIQHTRNQDVLWFYGIIVGAPLLVLWLGIWLGWWRLYRSQRRSAA
jgi:hypothetical protein